MKLGCIYDKNFDNHDFIDLINDQNIDVKMIEQSAAHHVDFSVEPDYMLILIDYQQPINPTSEKLMFTALKKFGQNRLIICIAHQIEGKEKTEVKNFGTPHFQV